MNNKKAVSGVITAIIMVAIALAVVGLAYVFFTGALTGANQSVQTQKGVLDDILPDGDTDDEGGTDTVNLCENPDGNDGTCKVGTIDSSLVAATAGGVATAEDLKNAGDSICGGEDEWDGYLDEDLDTACGDGKICCV